MQKIHVLPRDIQPGDVIDRVTHDLAFVEATIVEVKKVTLHGSTSYKVYLDRSEVPESQRGWAEHRHLSPFYLSPRNRVEIKRAEA